ncbi:MAG: hypothetical protein KBS60_05370 [Phascolarctobacterium sp.]|nr:hypothetical protein [Candidatus Phascolarctobacterium caballi]
MEKKRYKGICPDCGGTLWICKSIMQEAGMTDLGHGTCIHCKSFLHLEFNEDKQEFDCVNWEKYRRQIPEGGKKQ